MDFDLPNEGREGKVLPSGWIVDASQHSSCAEELNVMMVVSMHQDYMRMQVLTANLE